MDWTWGVAAALSMTMMDAGQAGTRLTQQRVEGARRICIYGQGREARARRIGRGEPCPQRFRQPEPQVELIPSMAVRADQVRRNGALWCVYRYAGRSYTTRLPLTSYCPLTPTATMQPISPETPEGPLG